MIGTLVFDAVADDPESRSAVTAAMSNGRILALPQPRDAAVTAA